MRLIVLLDEAMVADVVCGPEPIHVGSAEDCRVRLDDTRVAPRQLTLAPVADGTWTLEQLDSTCEVRLNRSSVTGPTPLRTGDEIHLLDYAIRVYPEYDERAAARPAVGTSRAQLERFAQAKLPLGAILKKSDEPITVQPGQLAALNRANLAASACTAAEELMDVTLKTLLDVFAAQRAWIGVRRVNYGPMEYVEGRLITGKSSDMPEIGNDLKPRVLDRAQFVLLPIISRDEPTSVLAGPLCGPDGTLGMAYIDTGESGRRYETRDLDFFALLLSVFASQLDAIFKTLARTRAAMIEGQVSVAHEVQARLTPRMLPQSDELQWGAFREPGRERSSDIYDVARVSPDLIAFLIAQTPAAGALPSILMTQAQTAFRIAAMHQDGPHTLLRSLNHLLYDGQKDHPLHCCAGYVEPSSGRMRYALAGHLGAFIVGARGDDRPLTPAETAPALGLTKNPTYAPLKEQLAPGETLVLFTSGVTTAKNRKEETFGEERFVDILCDGFGQLASATLKEMLTDLRNFTEAGSQPDDITVILAHRV